MTSVTGYTATRMKSIEDNAVVNGTINGSGHLILTKHNGVTIDAGYIIGPKGDPGPTGAMEGAVPIGGCIPFYGFSEPDGWLFTNGQEIDRTTYSNLFDVIGVAYGQGDGVNTFNVPDSRDRMLLQSVDGSNLGVKGGAKTVTLTSGQIPSHTHPAGTLVAANAGSHGHTIARAWGGTNPTGVGQGLNRVSANGIMSPNDTDQNGDVASAGAHTHTVSGSTAGNTGGGSAHDNMPPYIVCNQLIRAF